MKTDEKNMEFQILEAAERLFIEQGYTKTTTAQIAKSAGCNQALVHYYYRTKDNLFERIFEEKIRLITTNILVMDPAETVFEKRVAKIVEAHFDFLNRNPKLASFVLNEILSNPERIHSLVEKLQQYPKSLLAQLDSYLSGEIEDGTIRPISSIDLLFTIVSLNVAPFLIMPMLQKTMTLSDAEVRQLLENRKQETVNTVLARLRK